MARIYKQRDKWCFAVEIGKDEKGNRRRKVRGGFLREKDARKAAIEYESKFLAGVIVTNESNITLHDFMWTHWYEYHKNYVKLSTAFNIKTYIKRIDKYFGKKVRLKDVKPLNCSRFCNYLLDGLKLKRGSALSTLAVLKMCFNYALTVEKILSYNPCEHINLPKYSNAQKEALQQDYAKKHLYLEHDELTHLFCELEKIKTKHPAYYAMIYTMLYTGMRIGEVCGLLIEDIDFKKKIISVQHNLVLVDTNECLLQTPKSKSSLREISIPDKLLAVMKEYKRWLLENKMKQNIEDSSIKYFFISQKGIAERFSLIRTTTFKAWIYIFAKKINMPFIHSHIFRHTHTSLLIEAGVPIPDIAKRLGHSSSNITEKIYAHMTRTNNFSIAHKIDKLLAR